MAEILKNKHVLLGISGGIAAFKACELLRQLIKAGAKVRVVMTEAATKFITPLTFSALGAESVSTDMWDEKRDSLEHVSWSDWADIFVIAPATANIIAKMAAGIADEVLSTQILAYDGPKIIAPAMNVKMWRNPATQRNIAELKKHGVIMVGPTTGQLASLITAEGRLVEPDELYQAIVNNLNKLNDLADHKILVTAGPTIEPLDPVRFISNRSSGKMGYAIAEAAASRGADVALISGPVAIAVHDNIKLIRIETADQLKMELGKLFPQSDSVIMAAAVADYKPRSYSKKKIKKTEPQFSLNLVKNPDILSSLAVRRKNQILVGFALETENLKQAAQKKLNDKKLDIIVANNPTRRGVEFGSDYNKAMILVKNKKPLDLPVMSKIDLAHKILDELVVLLKSRKK
jgi:phosphopantothenoylcysteine decarboxylase/phosphopantothenate--cysteine ligase